VLIDWHTHVHHPDDQAKARWLGKCPMNIEDVIKCHERAQLDISVISNAVHYIRLMEDPEIAVHLRASNEYLAKCRDRYKDKVIAMATSVPNGGEENLRELERAVKENDLRAVIINASHKGEYPDADGAKPFWKLVTDLDIPVFLHPGWCGDAPAMQEYRLNSSVGRPADNCLSLARIIVRGILEQFPTLKLVGSHLGGGICETIGRLDYAYNLIEESWFLGPYEPMYIKHAPSHYLKMLYLDSACYATPAAKMALETVGPDQFLFGSDSPPMIPLKDKAMQMMKDMNMPPDVYAKVMGGNAARLLKLH
jgi:aminocarboxymuconate-semialdehyde decarboxylase